MVMRVRPEELNYLCLCAQRAKLGIVEIGCLDGKTACHLARNARVPVYSIDPIIPDSMDPELMGSEIAILENTEGLSNFFFIKDYSFNVVLSWDKEFDFIFFDGDHHYEAVKKDFKDWFPLLSSGGCLAFHDSGAGARGGPERWPGPSRLADELIADGNDVIYVETIESLTVFRKK